MSARGNPESGTLPGRYEWVVEPDGPMSVPTDPAWNRFSDNMRQWTASAGAQVERNDGLGTADATEHARGTEEPEATIGYDKQLFDVDGAGDPQSAEAYGLLRDQYNNFFGTLLCVGRVENDGGNFDSGIRQYTVIRGTAFETVTETYDPSENDPVLVEAEASPKQVRSYIIHQPASDTAVTVSSTSANDTMDVTIEDEGAATSETVTLSGTTAVTTTALYGDIDAVWLSEEPEGDITVESGDGTVLVESTGADEAAIAGGLTYSDDTQPVDGDRGVPALGAGSHAAEIGTTFEYFIGDRVERPSGVPYRPRLNSLELTVENSIEDESLHYTRAPSNDPGNRTIQLSADIAGPRASHDSMMESLQKSIFSLGHQLSGGVREFPALLVQESDGREYEADDQAVAAVSETLEATNGETMEYHPDMTLDEVFV